MIALRSTAAAEAAAAALEWAARGANLACAVAASRLGELPRSDAAGPSNGASPEAQPHGAAPGVPSRGGLASRGSGQIAATSAASASAGAATGAAAATAPDVVTSGPMDAGADSLLTPRPSRAQAPASPVPPSASADSTGDSNGDTAVQSRGAVSPVSCRKEEASLVASVGPSDPSAVPASGALSPPLRKYSMSSVDDEDECRTQALSSASGRTDFESDLEEFAGLHR